MGWDMSKGLEGLDHNFLTGKVEDLVQWSRSKSSWPVTFRQLGLFGLVEMAIFIGLVFEAYVYVWKKGGLEWD